MAQQAQQVARDLAAERREQRRATIPQDDSPATRIWAAVGPAHEAAKNAEAGSHEAALTEIKEHAERAVPDN